MRKKFYKIIFLLVSFSCDSVHSDSEKKITKGDDSVEKLKIEVSSKKVSERMNTTDNLLFHASGIEPGWFVQLYDNKLRLLVDYGHDSLVLSDSFSGIKENETYTYKNNNIELIIKTKSCIAEGSGETLPKEVKLNWKNKTYKGCGQLINK